MGIDPNNHRLNQIQTLYHPDKNENENEEYEQLSPRTRSSGTRNIIASSTKPLDEVEPTCNDQQVSDSASSIDHEILCSSQLNLDLTIGFSSSSTCSVLEAKQQTKPELHINKEVDQGEQSPTLFLFL